MRLIDADDAIKAFEEEKQKAKEIRDDFAKFPDSIFEQSIYNEAVKAWRTAINIVKKLPTIEQKKGKWLHLLEEDTYQCSECLMTERSGGYYCYCPNCGADMRGETDE